MTEASLLEYMGQWEDIALNLRKGVFSPPHEMLEIVHAVRQLAQERDRLRTSEAINIEAKRLLRGQRDRAIAERGEAQSVARQLLDEHPDSIVASCFQQLYPWLRKASAAREAGRGE